MRSWYQMRPGEKFKMRISEYCALADHQKDRLEKHEIVGGMIVLEMRGAKPSGSTRPEDGH